MGNQTSAESKNFSDPSLKNFYQATDYVRDSKDPCFGDIRIFKRLQPISNNPDENLVFAKYKLEGEKEAYTELYKECDLRLSYKHPNLLDFLGYDFTCAKNICGTTNKCALYFEYYDRDLEHELNKRSKSQNHFSEQEVLYLLKSLVSVGAYLERQHIYHGDLRSCNVFMSPQGKVKVGDHILLNQFRNNYYKALYAGNTQVFLTPYLMQCLSQKYEEPSYDEFKADVWSLGMTILEICSLFPSIQCYDYENCVISENQIQDLLTSCSQYYSQYLIGLISDMLQENEEFRPDMGTLNLRLNGPTQINYASGYKSQYIPPETEQIIQASRIQNLQQSRPVNQSLQQTVTQTGFAPQQQSRIVGVPVQSIKQQPVIVQSQQIPVVQQSQPITVQNQMIQPQVVKPQYYQSGQTGSFTQVQPYQQASPRIQSPQKLPPDQIVDPRIQSQQNFRKESPEDKFQVLQSRIQQALQDTQQTIKMNSAVKHPMPQDFSE